VPSVFFAREREQEKRRKQRETGLEVNCPFPLMKVSASGKVFKEGGGGRKEERSDGWNFHFGLPNPPSSFFRH